MASQRRGLDGGGVWSTYYRPFGEAIVTGSASLDARLPGQWFQLETGLSWNWHRTYDPALGRYIQPDPLGLTDGPSLYGYAHQSPLMRIDPEGKATIVITNGNFPGTGMHSGFVVVDDGGRTKFIYDPGGSYMPNQCNSCRNGDDTFSENPDFGYEPSGRDYYEYQRRDGSDVRLQVYQTIPDEERQLQENADGCSTIYCATCTRRVLKTIGRFRDLHDSIWVSPKGLYNELNELKN